MSSLHIYRAEIEAYALCTLRSISFCIDTFNLEITWNFITLMVDIDFFPLPLFTNKLIRIV